MRAGAAHTVITNELGTWVQGATCMDRASAVRDELEANALLLEDGETRILFVSLDLGGLEPDVVKRAREAMSDASGVPWKNIIIAATHTGGPSVLPTHYVKPVDTEYLERLRGRLVDLAARTVETVRPARIGWGTGAARIGYNRRACRTDGSHDMGGNPDADDFAGLEGPDDPQHLALFAEDDDGLVAVLHHNTAHPCTFYGADFYSADFPGAARTHLREVWGAELPVLFFNGAQGDIATKSLHSPRRGKESREEELARLGHMTAGETLRLRHVTEMRDDMRLAHRRTELRIPVRLPDPEEVRAAEELLRHVAEGEERPVRECLFAHGARLLQQRFGDSPEDALPIHAVRIGDLALATEPCELFCRFGLDFKRRAPGAASAVIGLADGYCGYCPTMDAVIGGGYSGRPIYWTRLAADAGDRIVDAMATELHRLWRETGD